MPHASIDLTNVAPRLPRTHRVREDGDAEAVCASGIDTVGDALEVVREDLEDGVVQEDSQLERFAGIQLKQRFLYADMLLGVHCTDDRKGRPHIVTKAGA